eukprot:627927-Alexandrium_andersonii.AAC.1
MTPNAADEALQDGQFEAVPGPAQFKLRTREAMLHVRQFKLRELVIWTLCRLISKFDLNPVMREDACVGL